MARRTSQEDEASLTMTPLIDVVLLLLIFFVVTTVFVDREIELQLPDSQSSKVPDEKKKFTVELGRDGRLALNGETMTVLRFDQMIEVEASADNIRSVEIRADKMTVHGRVVEVLGIVKKHGVDNVGIAVKQAT
ncbi:MAG: biopolymer transporter ExbD [bacterium]|nr:biopolymer transporter ExbD [bacterium]